MRTPMSEEVFQVGCLRQILSGIILMVFLRGSVPEGWVDC